MGIQKWWRDRMERSQQVKQDLDANEDPDLIAQFTPELIGKNFVEGGAFVMEEIRAFREEASPGQLATFQERLAASHQSFHIEGRTMPYWANLWVLRTLQHEIAESGE